MWLSPRSGRSVSGCRQCCGGCTWRSATAVSGHTGVSWVSGKAHAATGTSCRPMRASVPIRTVHTRPVSCQSSIGGAPFGRWSTSAIHRARCGAGNPTRPALTMRCSRRVSPSRYGWIRGDPPGSRIRRSTTPAIVVTGGKMPNERSRLSSHLSSPRTSSLYGEPRCGAVAVKGTRPSGRGVGSGSGEDDCACNGCRALVEHPKVDEVVPCVVEVRVIAGAGVVGVVECVEPAAQPRPINGL
jgi:hypothetical protein